MFKILNCEPEGYSPKARAILEQAGSVTETPLDRAGLLSHLSGYDALIVRLKHQVDLELMDGAQALRVISSATTGVDHIDLDAAKQRGIAVLTLQGEDEFLDSIVATAEHTWALLLALVRNVPAAAESVVSGEWDRDRFKGTELSGKRLGLLGLGRLGSKVAAYGTAFGMDVSAFDPYREPWPGGVKRQNSLDGLLANSDVLSVHVPLNDETRLMIGAEQLALLAGNAMLINTSRADIVDEGALVELLEAGHLAGAALDVIGDERNETARRSGRLMAYLSDNWRSGRIVITPHIGGATHESMESTEIFMARKLVTFLQNTGEPGNR